MSPQMRHMVDEIIVFCIGRGEKHGIFCWVIWNEE